MKQLLLCSWLAFLISGYVECHAQSSNSIKDIREDLFYSDFNIDKCWEFNKSVKSLSPATALTKAYLAVSEALIAKYTWNPVSKYSYIKHSKELLEEAVKEDKENVEIRFLRLYIERSIPSYMGMSQNIKTDKAEIMENLDSLKTADLGADIIKYIANYMASPEVSTPEEATLIKSKLGIN